jgi:RNA polymerase sigma factor (sigma-70 family)
MKIGAFNRQNTFRSGTSLPDGSDSLVMFETLAMPLLNPLYNFARWQTRNREEAEDLVQETYLKAWQGFSSFQPGTNFRAWMYRILRNTFLTSCTSSKATMTVPLDSHEDGTELAFITETPESLLLELSNRELVRNAIEELPVHFRESLLLCEIDEMSYREISEVLSIPIGTVMSRLARARSAIYDGLRRIVQPRSASRAWSGEGPSLI